MRSIYTIALFLIALGKTFAQDSIEGVGPFKIGKTDLSIIDDIAKEQRTKVTIIDTQKRLRTNSFGKVIELKQNERDPKDSPDQAHACPNVRVFFVRKYVISDIDFKEVYLTFLDGKLVYFTSQGSMEIDDAVTAKYGKGEKDNESKPSAGCRGSLDKVYKTKWGSERIEASSYNSYSSTFDCSLFHFYSFSISDVNAWADIKACDENIEDLGTQEKKKKLKDF